MKLTSQDRQVLADAADVDAQRRASQLLALATDQERTHTNAVSNIEWPACRNQTITFPFLKDTLVAALNDTIAALPKEDYVIIPASAARSTRSVTRAQLCSYLRQESDLVGANTVDIDVADADSDTQTNVMFDRFLFAILFRNTLLSRPLPTADKRALIKVLEREVADGKNSASLERAKSVYRLLLELDSLVADSDDAQAAADDAVFESDNVALNRVYRETAQDLQRELVEKERELDECQSALVNGGATDALYPTLDVAGAGGSAAEVTELRNSLADVQQRLDMCENDRKDRASVTRKVAADVDDASQREAVEEKKMQLLRGKLAAQRDRLKTLKEQEAQLADLRIQADRLATLAAADCKKVAEDDESSLFSAATSMASSMIWGKAKKDELTQLERAVAKKTSKTANAVEQVSLLLIKQEKRLKAAHEETCRYRDEQVEAERREASLRSERNKLKKRVDELEKQVAEMHKRDEKSGTGDSELKERVEKLEKDKETLKRNATKAIEIARGTKVKLDQLKEKQNQSAEFMALNEKQLAEAQRKAAQLEKQLDAMNESREQSATGAVAKAEAQIDQLQRQLDGALSDLKKSQKSSAASVAAKAAGITTIVQLERTLAQASKARDQCEAARDKSSATHAAEVQRLQEELDAAGAEIQQLTQQRDTEKSAGERHLAQLAAARSAADEQRARHEMEQRDQDARMDAIAAVQSEEVANLEAARQDGTQRIAQLQGLLTTTRAEHAAQIDAFTAEKEQLEATIAQLEQTLVREQTAQKLADESRAADRAIDAQRIVQLEASVTSAESELRAANARYVDVQVSLEQHIDKLAQLERDLEQTRTQAAAADTLADAKLAAVTEQLEQLGADAEQRTLAAQRVAADQTALLAECKDSLTQIYRRAESLLERGVMSAGRASGVSIADELAQATAASGTGGSVAQAAVEQEQRDLLESVLKTFEQFRARLETSRNDLVECDNGRQAVDAQLDEARASIASLRTEIAEWKERASNMEVQIAQTTTTAAEMKDALAAERQRTADLTSVAEQTQKELDASVACCDRQSVEAKKLSRALEEQQTQCATLAKEISAERSTVLQQDGRIKELERQTRQLQTQVQTARDELDAARTECEEQLAKNAKVHKTQRDDLVAAADGFEQELAACRARLTQSEAQVQECAKAGKALLEKLEQKDKFIEMILETAKKSQL